MEVRNRYKGLDLIDRVPDELWMEVHNIVQETGLKNIDRVPDELWMEVHNIVQETGLKNMPKKKKCKKAKWLSEEAL